MKRKLVLFVAASLGLAVLPWNALAAQAEDGATEREIEKAKREIESVFTRKRGYLGVVVLDLTEELRKHFGAPPGAGVLVAGLTDGGPAAKAGVQIGDVLVSVGGEKVADAGVLRSLVAPRKEGEKVELALVRERKERTVTAAASEREMKHVVMRRWDVDGLPEIEGALRLALPDLTETRQRLETRLKEVEQRLKDLEKKLPPPGKTGEATSERL